MRLPDGTADFNIRAGQGRLGVILRGGLVFYVESTGAAASTAHPRLSGASIRFKDRPPRRLVTCIPCAMLAECAPQQAGGIHSECRTHADARYHRTDQGRAVFAPRLHDRHCRRHGGLYAGRRPRARRCHQDRYRWPHRGRRKDKGGRWRDARLLRASKGREEILRLCWWRWRFSACTNTSGM